MRATDASRHGVGALGVASIGLGLWLVAAGSDPLGVLVWLAGALVLHDGIIAPLVLAVGLLIAGRRLRGPLRGALLVSGSLVLITLPLLLRPGPPPNPSALPLPYTRNLVIVLVVVAAATAGGGRGRPPAARSPASPGRTGRPVSGAGGP
ncbi:hypothetical protein ACFU8I_10020 [Streptomyces sp. NPDC057540]|uniref:hypothetical protein n=1 Tax=Streptomyces sp. NPDC057540 TaxID=3346160 RepID=UPI003682022D